jgi:hypothetical protein
VSGEAPGASSTRQPGSVSATISASWRIWSFSVVEPMLNAWSCARVAEGVEDDRGQRQPAAVADAAVADQVQLGSWLATIDWVCAHVVPPL